MEYEEKETNFNFDVNNAANYDSNSRAEFRIYDRLKFRYDQAITLRNDEIQRLKHRLEMYKNSNNSNNQSINFNDPKYQEFLDLSNLVSEEKSKAQLKLTNINKEFLQKKQLMIKDFDRKIAMISHESKQIGSSSENQHDSFHQIDNDIDHFTSYVNTLINKPNKEEYDYNSPDVNKKDARSFDLRLFYDEIQYNEKRIKELKELIEKVSNNPSFASAISPFKLNSENSTELSLNESNFSTIDSINSEKKKFRKNRDRIDIEISQLLQEKRRTIVGIKNRIKNLEKDAQIKEKKINIARNKGLMTDTEIAETMIAQDKIKKKKEKLLSIYSTLETLSFIGDDERERMRNQLKKDNIFLKRELGRVDFIIYGKTGIYQKWRKLDDESLFKMHLPLH